MHVIKNEIPPTNNAFEFNVFSPKPLGDLFEIHPDTSPWENLEKYVRHGKCWLPNRTQFLSNKDILEPKNATISNFFSKSEATNYGIYILFFGDAKIFYVGIAARYSYEKDSEIKKIKSPEGIIARLQKHRQKCTGSLVSSSVNHTNAGENGWRKFALQRYEQHKIKGMHDTLGDCHISIINFTNPDLNMNNDKGILEALENELNIKGGALQQFGAGYYNYSPIARSNPNRTKISWKFNFLDFPC